MSLDHPGFADPVLDSQACFRAVLEAMSRPGSVQEVGAPAVPPPPLHRATAAALLTLVDAETPLWLDAGASAASEWVAFHCGAPRVPMGRAAFGLALSMVDLASFQAGTDEGPEDGATLVLQVSAIGSGTAYRLEGPGLARPAELRVHGLGAGFGASWAANRARFPRGIDLVLCAGDRLAALPRSVSVREA